MEPCAHVRLNPFSPLAPPAQWLGRPACFLVKDLLANSPETFSEMRLG